MGHVAQPLWAPASQQRPTRCPAAKPMGPPGWLLQKEGCRRAGGPSASSQDVGTWKGEAGCRAKVTVTVRCSAFWRPGVGGWPEKCGGGLPNYPCEIEAQRIFVYGAKAPLFEDYGVSD